MSIKEKGYVKSASNMRKLFKKLEITFNHTKNRKIPSTNNLAKLLFRVTFSRKIKRIFRTYEGAER